MQAEQYGLKQIRRIGAFIINLLVAELVSAAMAHPYTVGTIRTPMFDYVVNVYFLDTLSAFGLGVFVYWKFTPSSAKWVWVVGVGLLIFRAIHLWGNQHVYRALGANTNSLFWQMSGMGCNVDANACREWTYVTMPMWRTVWYSTGAYVCSLVSLGETRKRWAKWTRWAA